MPGVRQGVYHVELDERWHIGFGLRCLIDAKPAPGPHRRASWPAPRSPPAAWGDAIPEEIRAAIVPDGPPPAGDRHEADRGSARGGVAAPRPRRGRAGGPSRASRVGLTGVEAVVRLGVDERSAQPFAARIDCASSPARSPRTARTRFEDVVATSCARSSSAPRGMRAERLAQRGRGARARAPGRAARRGDDRGALPRAAAGAGVGHADAGDLDAPRGARWRPARHAADASACPRRASRRRPQAQRALAAHAARAARAPTASRRRPIARVLDDVPVATHDQRGIGTLHVGCPEDCDARVRRPRVARDRRGRDVERDLRADEAQRRGRGRRARAPPPARGRRLRARDDRRRRRALRGRAGRRCSSRPRRRASRRSTAITSWPSAPGCSASCAPSSRTAAAARAVAARPGSTPPGSAASRARSAPRRTSAGGRARRRAPRAGASRSTSGA